MNIRKAITALKSITANRETRKTPTRIRTSPTWNLHPDLDLDLIDIMFDLDRGWIAWSARQ